MHNYSVQNRYTTKTKIGNWWMEQQQHSYHFKEFLHNKHSPNNTALSTNYKLAFSQQPISLTPNTDNLLHNADSIMFKSVFTKGVLSFNLNEKVISDKEEQSYAVTTSGLSNKELAIQLRNCWHVQILNFQSQQHQGKVINYGDKIRIFTSINSQKLYLQSIPISPMRSSKFSRLQQVSLTSNKGSSSIWVLQHPDPKIRIDALGQPVSTQLQILIKHNNTAQHLASDKVNYVNEFGQQFQTYAKSLLSNNKTQNLIAEKVGHKTVDQPLRNQGQPNYWNIVVGKY